MVENAARALAPRQTRAAMQKSIVFFSHFVSFLAYFLFSIFFLFILQPGWVRAGDSCSQSNAYIIALIARTLFIVQWAACRRSRTFIRVSESRARERQFAIGFWCECAMNVRLCAAIVLSLLCLGFRHSICIYHDRVMINLLIKNSKYVRYSERFSLTQTNRKRLSRLRLNRTKNIQSERMSHANRWMRDGKLIFKFRLPRNMMKRENISTFIDASFSILGCRLPHASGNRLAAAAATDRQTTNENVNRPKVYMRATV